MSYQTKSTKAWNEGVYLRQALNEVIGGEWDWGKSHHKQLMLTFEQSMNHLASTEKPSSTEEQSAIWNNGDLKREKTLTDSAEHSVRNKLLNNELIAVGYALPRSPSDNPIFVPQDLWSGKIDWAKSSVKANGLEVIAIRVNQAPTKEKAEIVKKGGRPSRAPQVMEALEHLHAQGQLGGQRTIFEICRRIRAYLELRYPKEDPVKGLSDGTLHPIVREFLDSLTDLPGKSAGNS